MFDNWLHPTASQISHEYDVEIVKKGNQQWFPSFDSFELAVEKAKEVYITPDVDVTIAYRSRTKTEEALLQLISGYRSYPNYRNENTLEAMYQGFLDGNEMLMPMVLEFSDGSMRVLGGNTRMDVAFQLNIQPKVLVLKVS